jgi:hypothetical protein
MNDGRALRNMPILHKKLHGLYRKSVASTIEAIDVILPLPIAQRALLEVIGFFRREMNVIGGGNHKKA